MKENSTHTFLKIEKKQRFSILISKMVLLLVGLLLLFLAILTLEMVFYLSPIFKIILVSLYLLSAVTIFGTIILRNRPIFDKKNRLSRLFSANISELFRNTFELIKSLKTG